MKSLFLQITFYFLLFNIVVSAQTYNYPIGGLNQNTNNGQSFEQDVFNNYAQSQNADISKEQYQTYLESNYDKYLQSQNLVPGIDTVNLNEEVLFANPEILELIGVSDDLLKDLQQINAMQDSLQLMKFKIQNANDPEALNITFLEAYIANQKKAIFKKFTALPQANLYGHDYFRKNFISIEPEDDFIVNPPAEYQLKSGDELTVILWGYRQLNSTYQVDVNGNLDIPLVGQVTVKGLRFSEAKELIKDRIFSVYGQKNNDIAISLTRNRRVRVNVAGEVFNPGTYRVSSVYSAFDILVATDGPNDIGSVRNIMIKRNGKTEQILDVYEFLNNPNSEQDNFLGDNDYIIVPPVGKVVHIAGEVKRPFNYELKEGETLKDLIKYAGGLNPKAFTRTISVKRYEDNKSVWLDIPYDSLMNVRRDFNLLNGDTIFVNSIPDYVHNFVVVGGAVRAPGKYQFSENDRLSDLIYRARGPLENADMNRAYVFRMRDEDYSRYVIPFTPSEILINQNSPENILLERQDSIYFVSKEVFRQDLLVEISGEVRVPGEYEYVEGMTLQDFIYLSGGISREAGGSIVEVSRLAAFEGETSKKDAYFTIKQIEIGLDLKVNEQDAKFEMKPYDKVFIRRNPNFQTQQKVMLTGEVVLPGEYALTSKTEKVSSLIKRAGGLTSAAHKNASVLYRAKRPEELSIEEKEFLENFREEEKSKIKKTDEIIHEPVFYAKVLLDVEEVLNNPNNSPYDYYLSDLDSLHIPKIENIVTIRGQMQHFDYDTVATVIKVPFDGKLKDARHYIRKYGAGFGDYGKRLKTYVEQPNGEIERTQSFFFFKKYPKVEEGATVFVDLTDRKKREAIRLEERERRNWNDAFESFTSKVTAILSILVIVQQVRN